MERKNVIIAIELAALAIVIGIVGFLAFPEVLPQISIESVMNVVLMTTHDYDSECDLAYEYQDSVYYKRGQVFVPTDPDYEEKAIKRADEFEKELYAKVQKMTALERMETMNTYDYFEEMRNFATDQAMNDYSIDPSLRSEVHMLKNWMYYVGDENNQYLKYIILPISLEIYTDDIECGKKLLNDHGNKIFKEASRVYGEDFASEQLYKITIGLGLR